MVDDEPRNIFALTAFLEGGHAEVATAGSGAAALALLEEAPAPDMILMDIMMPTMDGYATIRAIRQLDQFKTIPIIAVTGKAVQGEHERCVDAGANDFVPKPIDSAALLATIRRWLPVTART